MRIDSHMHLWRRARGDYNWLTPDLVPLWRDFEPEDAMAVLSASGIARALLVQAAPTIAETQYLLSVATAHTFVHGVIGWIDFEDPSCVDSLTHLALDPKFLGIRPMLQDLDEDDWILNPSFAPVFDSLINLDLCFDALIRLRHLRHIAILAKRHPRLKIVIDHAAKPILDNSALSFKTWVKEMGALAALPSVTCKVSGLITEAGPDWSVVGLAPYTDVLLNTFGPQRLLWGSDWPVCTLVGTYEEWFQASKALLGGLSSQESADIFGINAAKLYHRKTSSYAC